MRRTLMSILALSLAACGNSSSNDASNNASDACGAVSDSGVGPSADTAVETSTDTGANDTGVVVASKGRLRFGVSIGNSKLKSLAVTLDGTSLTELASAPMTGGPPAFSAGTLDEGREVEPGLHRFGVTITADVILCRTSMPSPCDPVTVEGRLVKNIDLTVNPGQELTAIAVFRVMTNTNGNEQVIGRIAHFDSTPATSGSLAGVARLALVREPGVLFEGTDTIKFGSDPKAFIVEADDEGIMTVPPGAGGTLNVQMSTFVSPEVTTGTLPAVAAGHVLPVIVWKNTLTIPSDRAGAGKNVSP